MSKKEAWGGALTGLAALISAAVGVMVYMDNRKVPSPPPVTPITPVAVTPSPSPLDITGTWSTGSVSWVFSQIGSTLSFKTFNLQGGQIAEGKGTINGNRAYISYARLDGSEVGEIMLDVAENGQQATGNWSNNHGYGSSFQLFR
jgi:hypothetical protein